MVHSDYQKDVPTSQSRIKSQGQSFKPPAVESKRRPSLLVGPREMNDKGDKGQRAVQSRFRHRPPAVTTRSFKRESFIAIYALLAECAAVRVRASLMELPTGGGITYAT